MELEKTLTIGAPRQHVWDLLLDPTVMAGCVPGTQSVEVLSDDEYVAEIKVKISFIAARFKIKTRIVERRPPDYLRIEGTGEDSSVASSMRQTSELFLTDLADGGTEIRIKATADVLGRLGSFGLSVMKTKADRMWDEFGANFSAVALRTSSPTPRQDPAPLPSVELPARPARAAWWQRLVGPSPVGPSPVGAIFGGTIFGGATMAPAQRLPTDIYVELPVSGGVVRILWPASAASEAARWLKDIR